MQRQTVLAGHLLPSSRAQARDDKVRALWAENLARSGAVEYRWGMAKQGKEELLENLRGMVRDMLKLRAEGGAYAKLARAHGYVDGYMRVLLETGIADSKTLLGLVADERRTFDGPATAEVSVDDDTSSVPGRRIAAA